jgi:hypothetical protein
MGIGLGGSRRKRDVFAVADPNFSHGPWNWQCGTHGTSETFVRLAQLEFLSHGEYALRKANMKEKNVNIVRALACTHSCGDLMILRPNDNMGKLLSFLMSPCAGLQTGTPQHQYA